jgi:hypothetical protein
VAPREVSNSVTNAHPILRSVAKYNVELGVEIDMTQGNAAEVVAEL